MCQDKYSPMKQYLLFRDNGHVTFDSDEQYSMNQLHTILEVRKQIEMELTKVIEFEEKLAHISPQRLEMLRPDMLTPYSIDSLSNEFPFLNWRQFFDSSLQSTVDEGMKKNNLIVKY